MLGQDQQYKGLVGAPLYLIGDFFKQEEVVVAVLQVLHITMIIVSQYMILQEVLSRHLLM